MNLHDEIMEKSAVEFMTAFKGQIVKMSLRENTEQNWLDVRDYVRTVLHITFPVMSDRQAENFALNMYMKSWRCFNV